MVSRACWLADTYKLSCLEVFDGLFNSGGCSKQIHGDVSGLERVIGVRPKIAADNRIGFLVRDKLSHQRASPARCVQAFLP